MPGETASGNERKRAFTFLRDGATKVNSPKFYLRGESVKIIQTWKRNSPDTESGESITVTIRYSSRYPEEIEELQKLMPKGMLVMEVGKDGKA